MINFTDADSFISKLKMKYDTPQTIPLNPIKAIKTINIGMSSVSKVIFNPPATIIVWKDGTKTVVKCADEDEYNRSAGIALCIMKKVYGDDFHCNLKKLLKLGIEDEERKEAKRWRNVKPVES